MKLAIWGKLWRLSLDKRSSSSLTFSLRYYKDIVKLFFWVLWSCLTTQTQSDTINLSKTFAHLQAKKTTSPPPPLSFSGDIAKICKLMLGTLVMTGCTYPKWYYQFAEDLNVYLHAKNKLQHSLLSWDIHFKESCNLISR